MHVVAPSPPFPSLLLLLPSPTPQLDESLKGLATQQEAIQSEIQSVEEQAKAQRHDATSTFKELTNHAQQLKDETAQLNDDLDKITSEGTTLESGMLIFHNFLILNFICHMKTFESQLNLCAGKSFTKPF